MTKKKIKLVPDDRDVNQRLDDVLGSLQKGIGKTSIASRGPGLIVKQDALKFLRLIPDNSVDLIVTDPPYSGMNQHLLLGKGRIVGKYKDRGENGKWFEEFHDTEENYHAFLGECHRVLRPNSAIFIMFDSYSLLTLGPLLRDHFDVKNIVVWDKVSIGMGHYFRRQSELIMYATKGKQPLVSRSIPDVWRIKRLVKAPYPTQKPVELFQAMIGSVFDSKTSSEKIVIDPFFGSGASMVAALRQGCKFIGADVSANAFKLCGNRLKHVIATGEDLMQPNSAIGPVAPNQKVWW
jgi:site-specific DNA-methyltransferase (adenine-specific)